MGMCELSPAPTAVAGIEEEVRDSHPGPPMHMHQAKFPPRASGDYTQSPETREATPHEQRETAHFRVVCVGGWG